MSGFRSVSVLHETLSVDKITTYDDSEFDLRGYVKMFAIVQTGGKQYNVTEGDIIKVEKLSNAVGDKINLEVLLVSDGKKTIAGTPTVKGAEVTAEVLSHGKGDKIVVYKYKPKKNERKKQGHRQPWTELKIASIKM